MSEGLVIKGLHKTFQVYIIYYTHNSWLADGSVFGGLQAVLPEQAQWSKATVATFTGPLCPQGMLLSRRQGTPGLSLSGSSAAPLQQRRQAGLYRYQNSNWNRYIIHTCMYGR